jgi:RNA polymerase sigma-70 factor (ECF subfamily)
MPRPVNHDWFLQVLSSHQRLIHKICWAYGRSHEEREDLFQEVVARLFSAAANYDPARKLSTWIYRVALNVAIDYRRRDRRRGKERPGLEGVTEPAAEHDPGRADQLRDLHELLERQSEADRALLLLHLEGNSHREIGEVLGLTETNVGTRLNRLKQSLRDAFHDEPDNSHKET